MGHIEGNFTSVVYIGRKVPKGQYGRRDVSALGPILGVWPIKATKSDIRRNDVPRQGTELIKLIFYL